MELENKGMNLFGSSRNFLATNQSCRKVSTKKDLQLFRLQIPIFFSYILIAELFMSSLYHSIFPARRMRTAAGVKNENPVKIDARIWSNPDVY